MTSSLAPEGAPPRPAWWPCSSQPGPFSFFLVVVEPPPVWLSMFGLTVFTGLVIMAAGWRSRHMEVKYGDD